MYHFVNGTGSPVIITLTFRDSPSVTVVAGISDKKAGFAIGRFLVTPIDAEQSVYSKGNFICTKSKQRKKIISATQKFKSYLI